MTFGPFAEKVVCVPSRTVTIALTFCYSHTPFKQFDVLHLASLVHVAIWHRVRAFAIIILTQVLQAQASLTLVAMTEFLDDPLRCFLEGLPRVPKSGPWWAEYPDTEKKILLDTIIDTHSEPPKHDGDQAETWSAKRHY